MSDAAKVRAKAMASRFGERLALRTGCDRRPLWVSSAIDALLGNDDDDRVRGRRSVSDGEPRQWFVAEAIAPVVAVLAIPYMEKESRHAGDRHVAKTLVRWSSA